MSFQSDSKGFTPTNVKSFGSNLSVKSKVWIEDENGRVVFGTGRLYILQAVSRHGSIHAAAQELQMSYRAVWGKIRATEKRLGQDLLDRKTGGVRGGGSKLTPFAREIIERFEKLQTLQGLPPMSFSGTCSFPDKRRKMKTGPKGRPGLQRDENLLDL